MNKKIVILMGYRNKGKTRTLKSLLRIKKRKKDYFIIPSKCRCVPLFVTNFSSPQELIMPRSIRNYKDNKEGLIKEIKENIGDRIKECENKEVPCENQGVFVLLIPFTLYPSIVDFDYIKEPVNQLKKKKDYQINIVYLKDPKKIEKHKKVERLLNDPDFIKKIGAIKEIISIENDEVRQARELRKFIENEVL